MFPKLFEREDINIQSAPEFNAAGTTSLQRKIAPKIDHQSSYLSAETQAEASIGQKKGKEWGVTLMAN